MRKTVLLAAMALMASGATALAGHPRLSLDGYCNAYTIRNDHGHIAFKSSGCGQAYGGGIVAAVKGIGKQAVIALHDPDNDTEQFEYIFSYPFTNGGSWELYGTADGGITFHTLAGGSYSMGAPDAPRGTKSVTRP